MIQLDTYSIAILGLVFTAAGFLCARVSETKKEATSDAEDMQGVKDSLDYIKDTVRDTRSDVRAINSKLSDHAETIAELRTRVGNCENRLDKGGL